MEMKKERIRAEDRKIEMELEVQKERVRTENIRREMELEAEKKEGKWSRTMPEQNVWRCKLCEYGEWYADCLYWQVLRVQLMTHCCQWMWLQNYNVFQQ